MMTVYIQKRKCVKKVSAAHRSLTRCRSCCRQASLCGVAEARSSLTHRCCCCRRSFLCCAEHASCLSLSLWLQRSSPSSTDSDALCSLSRSLLRHNVSLDVCLLHPDLVSRDRGRLYDSIQYSVDWSMCTFRHSSMERVQWWLVYARLDQPTHARLYIGIAHTDDVCYRQTYTYISSSSNPRWGLLRLAPITICSWTSRLQTFLVSLRTSEKSCQFNVRSFTTTTL